MGLGEQVYTLDVTAGGAAAGDKNRDKSNGKSEIQGSLRSSGKCAAFG
jgi:hypothetical protein